jgi:hypothetical protein
MYFRFVILFGIRSYPRRCWRMAEDTTRRKIRLVSPKSLILFGPTQYDSCPFIGPELPCGGTSLGAIAGCCLRSSSMVRNACSHSRNSGAGALSVRNPDGIFLLRYVIVGKAVLGVCPCIHHADYQGLYRTVGVMKARTFNDLGIAGVREPYWQTRSAWAWDLRESCYCLCVLLG